MYVFPQIRILADLNFCDFELAWDMDNVKS